MKPRSAKLTRCAATTTAVVALALGAVACTKDSGSSATTAAPSGASTVQPSAATPSTPGSAPTSNGSGSGSATTGTQASTRCHTGDLKANVAIQQAGSAMVMLTNKSTHTCTTYGYLGYGGLLADNSKVTVPTTRAAHPGPPVQITLKPGTTAFSGLKWAGCDKGDETCKVLGAVVVTPPDETTQLTAAITGLDGKPVPQLVVSAAGFTAGSLQPSNQGVVFPVLR